MLCTSIAPESRTLAKVDLRNAANQSDLVELCLDRFIKAPDVKELLEGIETPVLVSCRRKQDGGAWEGTEDHRLRRLRAATAAKPAYVEIDIDNAAAVELSEGTKRVVSFTSLDGPLEDIEGMFERAAGAGADVAKFTWPTPTLDDAWPMLEAISHAHDVPAVGLGLGHGGLSFSLLGRKYGSPWIYGALESGMESYDGQCPLAELEQTHRWRDIDGETRFIGVLGFGASREQTVRAFNAGFARLQINARCLPLEVGKFDNLAEMLDALQISAIVASRHLGEHILPLAEHPEESAGIGRNADLLLKKKDGWHAYNSIWRSAIKSLERRLLAAGAGKKPLDGRNVLVFGAGPLAASMVYGLQKRGAWVTVTSPTDVENESSIAFCPECGASVNTTPDLAEQMADQFDAMAAPFQSASSMQTDVVVFADPSLHLGYAANELNPSFLNSSMTVLDLARIHEESELSAEARHRGCRVIEADAVTADQIATQFKSVAGKELP
jgi:3-dehydroquinate dehydratase/shikimate dehydrogenase